jgi:hypothetical protein
VPNDDTSPLWDERPITDHFLKAAMLKPVFYDFEASGLDGFPIEVGWAFVDDQKRIVSDSSLILPDPKWNLASNWDEGAEQIHGISVKHLMEKGIPTSQVAQQLNQALRGLDLYSDSLFDQKWMRQLYESASIGLTFTLQDKPAPILIEELRAELGFTEDDMVGLYRALDHKAPHLDRARPDARHWAARWQALLKQ